MVAPQPPSVPAVTWFCSGGVDDGTWKVDLTAGTAGVNGAAVMEWLNVSEGTDLAADWEAMHREIVRDGFAYVGVSVQKVGVEGGPSLTPNTVPIKKADPARYGRLSHPGDAFAYDIYSQAGRAVRGAAGAGVLGPLVAKRLLATGDSQSAAFLTTYVDAIDSPHSVRYSVPVGAVRPLYCTAAGRVLLAFAEKTWQEQYVSTTKLEPRTPRTIATQKGLREELERVRKTQISVSIGEMFPEAAAISAPVFGADGNLAAAIAVGGPTERLNPRIAELRPIITDVAKRASGNGTDLPKVVEKITPARRASGKRVAAA